jgi:hypothetical protein
MDELWLLGRSCSARCSSRRVSRSSSGGLSVLFGIWGDLGALLLIVTLIPVTFLVHTFWVERDPMAKQTDWSL